MESWWNSLEGSLPVMLWAEVSQVCGGLVLKAPPGPNLYVFVERQESCFIQHQQKSCWIFSQGEKGLDLAAVGVVKVCVTKASSRQSDFLYGAILQFSDYINNHVFFSRQQVMAPGGAVQLYNLYKLL